MRRSTIEATDENIFNSLIEDKAGRRSEVLSFCEILDGIEGNYSIFIDSPWGYGKTFFVREVALCLKEANSITADGDVQLPADIGLERLEHTQLPIYYNAWENDYRDEPVLSLIETLVEGFRELKGEERLSPDFENVAGKLLASFNIGIRE